MTAQEMKTGCVSVATDRIADTISDLNSYMRRVNENGVTFHRNATRYDFCEAEREMMDMIKYLEAVKERAEDGIRNLQKSVDAWNSIID